MTAFGMRWETAVIYVVGGCRRGVGTAALFVRGAGRRSGAVFAAGAAGGALLLCSLQVLAALHVPAHATHQPPTNRHAHTHTHTQTHTHTHALIIFPRQNTKMKLCFALIILIVLIVIVLIACFSGGARAGVSVCVSV
jgi:hypothetical protein